MTTTWERAGFALIEVLLALAIGTTLLTALFGAVQTLRTGAVLAETAAARQRVEQAAIRALRDDLELAIGRIELEPRRLPDDRRVRTRDQDVLACTTTHRLPGDPPGPLRVRWWCETTTIRSDRDQPPQHIHRLMREAVSLGTASRHRQRPEASDARLICELRTMDHDAPAEPTPQWRFARSRDGLWWWSGARQRRLPPPAEGQADDEARPSPQVEPLHRQWLTP